MIRNLAWLFAAAFLGAGIFGFIPGLTTDMGEEPGAQGHVLLLGLFQVNVVHNVIHLVSGALAAIAALTSTAASRLYFIVIGLVYAAVGVLAFVTGGAILGMTHMNMADNLLHLALGAAALVIGLVLPAAAPARA